MRAKEEILEHLAEKLRNNPDLPMSVLNTIVSELNLEVMIDMRDALKDINITLWYLDYSIREKT